MLLCSSSQEKRVFSTKPADSVHPCINFELFTQVASQPVTRAFLAGSLLAARTGLAALFLDQDESTITDETSRTIGTFHHVLLSGLILQWLIDPASSLSAKDLIEALRRTAELLQPRKKKPEIKRKRKRRKSERI